TEETPAIPLETNNEHNAPAEEPAANVPEHHQLSDLPVFENDANSINEAPPAVIETQPEPVSEIYEAPIAETQAEAVNETPEAEPIINYAAGLGHRMPPDE